MAIFRVTYKDKFTNLYEDEVEATAVKAGDGGLLWFFNGVKGDELMAIYRNDSICKVISC